MADFSHAVADAQSLIGKLTPLGWEAQFVEPPWMGYPPTECRACGRVVATAPSGMKWGDVTITHRDHANKVLRWSRAFVCEPCGHDRAAMSQLAVSVFEPLLPPGPVPEGGVMQ